MAPSPYPSGRILKLRAILSRETDEDHKLSGRELLARLEEAGYHSSPETLRTDMKALAESGCDIVSRAGRGDSGYFSNPEPFTLPEIKTLLDAVQASGYIPKDKTEDLTRRLLSLVSVHQEEDLKKSAVLFNTRKHSNKWIFHNIAACDAALREHTRLSFRYFDLSCSRKKLLHNNGRPYTVEPYALIVLEDNYYLLALRADVVDAEEAARTYRLDRMKDISVLRSPISPRAEALYGTAAEYTRSVFRMFGGEEAAVTLRFPEELCGPVFDKFGEQIAICPLPDGEMELTETVQLSGTFFGWVDQFEGKMRITAPEAVRRRYRTHLDKLLTASR